MVIVHVWDFRGVKSAWGHASMTVKSTYISWWPEQFNRAPRRAQKYIPTSRLLIYDAPPIRNRKLAHDIEDEGYPPDHNIQINGLKEQAIVDWWIGFALADPQGRLQGPLQSWSTLERNCSTVVATALKAGGADQYASWTKSHNLVWKPDDVLSYANAVLEGISNR